jgi:hypothetical protein
VNWNTITTALIEIAGVTGPVLLLHHSRIRSVIKVIEQIVDALNREQEAKNTSREK